MGFHNAPYLQRPEGMRTALIGLRQGNASMSWATALHACAGKTLRFCYDRLSSLLKTLEITDMDDFTPLHMARTRALD